MKKLLLSTMMLVLVVMTGWAQTEQSDSDGTVRFYSSDS